MNHATTSLPVLSTLHRLPLLGAVLAALLVVFAFSGAAQAHEHTDLVVSGAWARATQFADAGMAQPTAEATDAASAMGGEMPMVDVSAAYFSLTNDGGHPVRISAASTTAAGVTELHTMEMDGDIMRMREIEGGIVVAAGETVHLQPGGLHVMLLDLPAPLVEGTAFVLTLTVDMLDDAGEVDGEPMIVNVGVPVLADAPPEVPFVVSGVWARATVFALAGETATAEATPAAEMTAEPMTMVDISAAYATITNMGTGDDTLIAVTAPGVTTIELHTMDMDGDVMRMREVEGGIGVPAGEAARLEPGGLHIMLIGLTVPLAEGTALPLTLTFASGTQMTVGAVVLATAPDHAHE